MGRIAVIHVGSYKAGSTTLQHALHARRKAFAKRNVLIATNENRRVTRRDVLALLEKPDDPDMTRLRAEIGAMAENCEAERIFLSSEGLYERWDLIPQVRGLASDIADDVRIVLYLREPAAYFLSFTQQTLKASDRFAPPDEFVLPYREIVTAWRDAFGEKLTIVPFQASAFPDGLVSSFAARFLGRSDFAESDFTVQHANSSMPAEAVIAMQRYHLVNHPDAAREITDENRNLRKALEEIAERRGIGTRCRLKPDLRELVLDRHAADLRWLKDAEGISFDAVDYGALRDGPRGDRGDAVPRFSDMVDHDPALVDEFVYRALRTLPARRGRKSDAKEDRDDL